MGASIGIAQGFKYAGIERPVLAAMGDGTFYHNGITGLRHRQTPSAAISGAARLACCVSCWSKTSRVIRHASRIRGSANE